MPKSLVTLLGRATKTGYEVEVVLEGVVQRDTLLWNDFPEVPHPAIVEAYMLGYVQELVKAKQDFLLEYNCGNEGCFGSHVMTHRDFKKKTEKI